jgi:hypothetical protein
MVAPSRADRQRAVHHELHVAGALARTAVEICRTRRSPIRRSAIDTPVRDEDHLQPSTRPGRRDRRTEVVDELDDQLAGWCAGRLARKKNVRGGVLAVLAQAL